MKSILFSFKLDLKLVEELDIKYKEINIAQHKHVNCLKCVFLDVPLRRLLYNALIQPHFHYAGTAWYQNLTKKLKDKLQVTQNKSIRF